MLDRAATNSPHILHVLNIHQAYIVLQHLLRSHVETQLLNTSHPRSKTKSPQWLLFESIRTLQIGGPLLIKLKFVQTPESLLVLSFLEKRPQDAPKALV